MNSQPASGYAPVNGVSMYWESRGSGTVAPLVLVHGGYGLTARPPLTRAFPPGAAAGGVPRHRDRPDSRGGPVGGARASPL